MRIMLYRRGVLLFACRGGVGLSMRRNCRRVRAAFAAGVVAVLDVGVCFVSPWATFSRASEEIVSVGVCSSTWFFRRTCEQLELGPLHGNIIIRTFAQRSRGFFFFLLVPPRICDHRMENARARDGA